MEEGGIEDGDVEIGGRDDHADLGAAEDHAIGAAGAATRHHIEIGGLGVRADDPLAELLIDDPMDRHAIGLGRHRGLDAVTLLQACLRMKPDRVLLAELRSKVAYDYIVNISSGHPGSITTVHAGSTAGAFEMLMLRVKESDEGQSLERADIQGLLRAEVDIVLQVHQLKREGPDGKPRKVRRLTEIHYDPAYKRSQLG